MAIRLDPKVAFSHRNRGRAYEAKQDHQRAIADYGAAIAQNAKDAYSLYGRGVAKSKSGDAAGGDADIAAAKAIKADIAEVYGAK